MRKPFKYRPWVWGPEAETQRTPVTEALHDFFHRLEREGLSTPTEVCMPRETYQQLAYEAIIDRRNSYRDTFIPRYPCNIQMYTQTGPVTIRELNR